MRSATVSTAAAVGFAFLGLSQHAAVCCSFLPFGRRSRERPPPSSASTATALYFFDFGRNKEPVNAAESSPPSRDTEKNKKQPRTADSQSRDDVDDEPDLIERMFTVFFGKPEESPFGLKRFDEARFPELYPATTTDFNVEPVVTDDRDMAKLRKLLKNTNLETRGLRLTYDANSDGWDPVTFHRLVDRQGPAIVVCTTRLGLLCGGYNPKGWVGYGESRGSIAAFLFREEIGGIGGGVGGASASWTKLKKVGGPSYAQYDKPETGPCFGVDSLVIPLSKEDPRAARSKLGSYFEKLPNGGNSLFGKDASVQLRSLKVYHGQYAEGEFVPFTDAEPFALY